MMLSSPGTSVLCAMAVAGVMGGCAKAPSTFVTPTHPAKAVTPQPLPLALTKPRALPLSTRTVRPDRSRLRWQRHAFVHAQHVLVIKVAGWRGNELLADVVEEIRGVKTPKHMPISGLGWLRAKIELGSQWIVATYRDRGAMPHGGVLAILPDTRVNRRQVRDWALPPWRYTPIVLAVRVARPPVRGVQTSGGRVELDVVKVLRGSVPHKRITDNAWPFAKFRPFKRGELYLLTAWTVTPSRYSKYPFFYAHSMTPIRAGQLKHVSDEVEAAPLRLVRSRVAASRRRLAELQLAWTFQRSPLVADTVVGITREQTTGCGGRHFTLVARRWRRGTPATRLATSFRGIGHAQVGARRGVVPYLFYGGGHCYHGRERLGDRFISAGRVAGRHAVASIADTPAARTKVRAWLSADRPRFAPLPVDHEIFSAKQPPKPRRDGRDNLLFEPAVDLEALSTADRRQWTHLQIVATRSVKLAGGGVYRWLHVRAVTDQRMSPHNFRYKAKQSGHEFMFAGVGLPAWKPGERYWGYWLDARSKRFRPSPSPTQAFHVDKLFIAGSFVRAGGFYLDQLLRRARLYQRFNP